MTDMKTDDRMVAFIADWRKRTTAHQKKYIILSTWAFVLAAVFCVFMFYTYQSMNYRRIVRQNMSYIQDSAIQEANQVEHEMESAGIFIANLANQYANLLKMDEVTTVEEKLTLLGDKNIFDRIAYVSQDGTDVSLEGVANVSDRAYFQNGMRGETGWEMIQKSRVTGRPTVVFYSPVIVDGRIDGIMIGFYEQSWLNALFSYQLFHYTPNTYLLQGDGTVVANSKNEEISDNLLARLSGKHFIGDVDYEAICEAIADEQRTTVTFSYVDGRDTSVGVIAQFNNSDWMLLSVLPNDVTAGMVSGANRTGWGLLIAVIAVFLLLISVLMFFLRKQRVRLEKEMAIASENLALTVQNEQQQFSIIESLGNAYSSIYYMDLEGQQYQRIKEEDTSALAIPDTGNAGQGFAAYIDAFVEGSEKERLHTFLDVSTFGRRLSGGGARSAEYQRTDGGWRRAIIVPAAHGEDGSVTAVVFAVQKIDREKKMELQTQKALQEAYEAANMASKAKTAFLSNMSHDIRTPMNAIVGMTAIAAANLDNTSKVSDCLKKITSSSRHLLGLINEVLDMSKIESGKVDLCEEEFSLSDLIEDLITIHQPLIREKNHTLVVKIDHLSHEKVIGDSTRLQQVFSNLLSNAIKYTPDNGRISITISEKETNKPMVGWYEVVFQDNGIGMSEEFQKNLFEPFARAEDERINGIQGTGLGMPIAKNIIHMMNGDITVKSHINQGSTFTVSFILRLRPEEDVNDENFVNLPVLVVDDDVIACESTCTMLDGLSMSSEWVTSGREAVERTAKRHEEDDDYYAVIVDWKMPDMNGIETTREIRKCVGEDIPIIVMSAYDWTEIEQEARQAGVNAFLSKPLFKSRVVSLFCDLLGNHSEKDAAGDIREEFAEYDFTGRKILLAEDNEINREIAVEILAMAGLETETAENGKVCLEKFSASQPGYYDLILMDIQMPVMNGYEATVAIRALSHSDAKKIPIVAMTANAFASDVRQAMDAGMNAHISKPIEVNRVLKVLQENIGGKVLRRSANRGDAADVG